MMTILPVLLSIPHSGREIPQEVKDRIILSQVDIFEDIDAYTQEIYDLGDKVTQVVFAKIARPFVDLNRAPDDLPPKNPDGVVKSHTCYGKVIYQSGLEPDDTLTRKLLKKYYFPYHQKIQQILDDKKLSINLALDCHSMAAVGPTNSPDKGEKRPMICLGNVYDKTCAHAMIKELASCFRKVFSLRDDEVYINRPFAGGYITRKYGKYSRPWIQVELNRSFYLRAPYFDRKTLLVDKNRLQELSQMFEDGLRLFF